MREFCGHGLLDPRYRRRLIIFVKEPRPGRVKTRLAAEIGNVAAARWYRNSVTALLRRVQDNRRWETVIAVAPDQACAESRCWPASTLRLPQGRGDLGQRMSRIFRYLPPGPALIIGSDIPGVSATRIHHAFQILGRSDAVFGPAPDGGYWLIGLRHAHALTRNALCGIRWSSEHALTDSVNSLSNLRIAYAAILNDIDNPDDYRAALSASSR